MGKKKFLRLFATASNSRVSHQSRVGTHSALTCRPSSHGARAGTRALLLCPPGLDVVSAFWACMCAGWCRFLLPLRIPSGGSTVCQGSAPLSRMLRCRWCSPPLVSRPFPRNFRSPRMGARSNGWPPINPTIKPMRSSCHVSMKMALAYLQYTSGSTATPRGVMVSHGNVLSHCKALSLAGGVSDRSRSLCWLPYFHDYGLLHGIISPFYAGIPCLSDVTRTFLR